MDKNESLAIDYQRMLAVWIYSTLIESPSN
jgi:hypothetical protein